MKKLLLILLTLVTLLIVISLNSCERPRRGEIFKQPQDFVEINGKVYKLVRIVPENGYDAIWIMYPKDTADKMPTVLNYNVQSGKLLVNETVIKID